MKVITVKANYLKANVVSWLYFKNLSDTAKLNIAKADSTHYAIYDTVTRFESDVNQDFINLNDSYIFFVD